MKKKNYSGFQNSTKLIENLQILKILNKIKIV